MTTQPKPQKRQWNLPEDLKNDFRFQMDKEFAITRGMLFNQLNEWKRTIYKISNQAAETLGVAGEAWDAMQLTPGDMDFINREFIKFYAWKLPDSILEDYAEKAFSELSAKSESALTINQKKLHERLEAALTINDQPFN